MMFLTLEELKKQLNIDSGFTADDDYITILGDVAEETVQKHIDKSLTTIAADNGGVLPSPLLHAMKLFVGSMYQNREVNTLSAEQEVPFGFEYLLSLYKNYASSITDGGFNV